MKAFRLSLTETSALSFFFLCLWACSFAWASLCVEADECAYYVDVLKQVPLPDHSHVSALTYKCPIRALLAIYMRKNNISETTDRKTEIWGVGDELWAKEA